MNGFILYGIHYLHLHGFIENIHGSDSRVGSLSTSREMHRLVSCLSSEQRHFHVLLMSILGFAISDMIFDDCLQSHATNACALFMRNAK